MWDKGILTIRSNVLPSSTFFSKLNGRILQEEDYTGTKNKTTQNMFWHIPQKGGCQRSDDRVSNGDNMDIRCVNIQQASLQPSKEEDSG